MRSKYTLWLTATLAVCLLSGAAEAAALRKAGEVAELIGTVYVQHNSNAKTADSGTWQQLKFGDAVYDKDLIRTENGSKVKLIFADESVVTIGPATRFRIDGTFFSPEEQKARVSLFSLISGKARALVSSWFSNLEKNRFEVRTPSAVAGVRGTEFVTIVGDKGTTQIIVMDGVVEVFNRRDKQRRAVYLGKGMTTKVAPNRVPSAPKPADQQQLQQAASDLEVSEEEASTEDSAGEQAGSDLDATTTLEEATEQDGADTSSEDSEGQSDEEHADEQNSDESADSDESESEEGDADATTEDDSSADESGDSAEPESSRIDDGADLGGEDGFTTGFDDGGFGDSSDAFGGDPFSDPGATNLPGQDVQRTTNVRITVDFR